MCSTLFYNILIVQGEKMLDVSLRKKTKNNIKPTQKENLCNFLSTECSIILLYIYLVDDATNISCHQLSNA